jgi:hypothetical protein
MCHTLKIVHASRFNTADGTLDERAGHFSISGEPKFEKGIPHVVIAKEKPTIVNSDNLGSVVRLLASLLEDNRFDAGNLPGLFVNFF